MIPGLRCAEFRCFSGLQPQPVNRVGWILSFRAGPIEEGSKQNLRKSQTGSQETL